MRSLFRWITPVLMLAGLLIVAPAVPASAAGTPTYCYTGPRFLLLNETTYKVITGFGHDVHSRMYSFVSGAAQQQWWTCSQSGLSGFVIMNVYDGTCLDVEGDSTSDGARIQTWACHWNSNQRWTWDSYSGRIRSRRSGKCVDIIDGNPNQGAPLAQYTCHTGWNQRFAFYGL